MPDNKDINRSKFFRRATLLQRVIGGIVLLVIAGIFVFLLLAGEGKIDCGLLFGYCGFKQRTGLPCPGCGITTSAIAFAQGRIFEAFYIQPAGAFICCCLVLAAVLALFTSVFGVYFRFLERFFVEVKVKYVVLAVLIIVAAGWAVTLARAMAEKG